VNYKLNKKFNQLLNAAPIAPTSSPKPLPAAYASKTYPKTTNASTYPYPTANSL